MAQTKLNSMLALVARTTPVFLCALVLAACSGSKPTPPAGDDDGGLPPGRSCEVNEDCQSGWCVEFPAGRACAFLCPGGECDQPLVCKRADGRDRESATICVPATSSLCQECTVDADCGPYGDLCVELDGGRYCTLDCSATLHCPEGYSCESFRNDQGQELSRQCFPIMGTCSCTAANAGMERDCEWVKPGVGRCPGMEVCQPGVGWVSCDAQEPFYEECNDRDDDCDTFVDEQINGAPLQRECGYGPTPRRQECTGVETCVDGLFSPCSLPEPPDEELLCDGLDDDCDGEVDEGVLHGPDACASCDDDPCPPGPDYDSSTARSCVEDSGSYFCGPIACRVPYFDVDGSEANGCEIEDDHERVGEDVVLNNQWATAFPLPGNTCGGSRESCLYCSDGDWIARCGLRIPSDDRQHLPSSPPSPNVDYLWFYQYDDIYCLVDTRVCVYFPYAGSIPGGTAEVCVSGSMSSLSTAPSFSSCWTIDLDTEDTVDVALNNGGNEYFYVRVRSTGSHYEAPYAVAAYDKAGYCPLGGASDPCSPY